MSHSYRTAWHRRNCLCCFRVTNQTQTCTIKQLKGGNAAMGERSVLPKSTNEIPAAGVPRQNLIGCHTSGIPFTHRANSPSFGGHMYKECEHRQKQPGSRHSCWGMDTKGTSLSNLNLSRICLFSEGYINNEAALCFTFNFFSWITSSVRLLLSLQTWPPPPTCFAHNKGFIGVLIYDQAHIIMGSRCLTWPPPPRHFTYNKGFIIGVSLWLGPILWAKCISYGDQISSWPCLTWPHLPGVLPTTKASS